MLHEKEAEFTGKDVNYYLVEVTDPKRLTPYTAECEDIIEALGMTFAEGCEFKALWRSCAARTLGKIKKGQDATGVYDAEKQVYYANRTLAKRLKEKAASQEPIILDSKKHIQLGIGENGFEILSTPAELNRSLSLCVHEFRSKECGYTNCLPTDCDKTFVFCLSLLNEKRFVGIIPLDIVQARG